MSRFNFSEGMFGTYKTISFVDYNNGNKFEILLSGATPLNFVTQINEKQFNILDGFKNDDEVKSGSGARCWIMTPFANRIPNGVYQFNGMNYKLNPLPPRTQVIHGLTSREVFVLSNVETNHNFIEATFVYNKIRPGKFEGYPFAIDVFIKYKLEENKLTIHVSCENVGDFSAPFQTGWHPYFKTSENGIENLILTVDANQIVLVDDNLIPLNGNQAFKKIDNFPVIDFRSQAPIDERKINRRIIDKCFADLRADKDNISKSSIYDPENGIAISLFQNGGVTLVFTGDTLSRGQRQSIAIEPMQFITNAFNREELKNNLTVLPGEKSSFKFGFEISKG